MSTHENTNETTLRALRAIRDLKARLEEYERAEREPIAVVGMACRFPGAGSVEEFWDVLSAGRCSVTEPPSRRTEVGGQGGYLEDLEGFDARFFGISPGEARHVDPRQRLALELAWEALESAGIPAERLRRSACGVFLAAQNGDFERTTPSDPEFVRVFTATGAANSVIANRVSYFLDVVGPSVSIDSACSGSLLAVHMAVASLRSGESAMALAGGVSVIQLRHMEMFYRRAGLLSESGRCRAFDRRADGLVRGEGAGLVVLKRLRDAEADGDRIFSVVRGSAANHNGRSNGLMSPSVQAQKALLREAYRKAGVEPGEVGYVEAHGTGTPVGDQIEVQALREVLGEGRAEGRACYLGSVKSNLGHTESAAGIASLIKACLVLKNGMIAPTLHVETPISGGLGGGGFDLEVCRTATRWVEGPGRRIAGVSSFGFGGMNMHVVLEAYQAPERVRGRERRRWILPLSAATPRALGELGERMLERVGDRALNAEAVGDLCVSAARRRSHLPARMAVVAGDGEELRARLEAFVERAERGSSRRPRVEKPEVLFYYPHLERVPEGLIGRLMESEAAFREECARLEAVGRDMPGWSGSEILGAEDGDGRAVSRMRMFALMMGLTAVWRRRGVRPSRVMAEGEGVMAGAVEAGAMSMEEAVRRVELSAEAGGRLTGLDGGSSRIPFETGGNGVRFDADSRTDQVVLVIGPVSSGAGEENRGAGGSVLGSWSELRGLDELEFSTAALFERHISIDWLGVYPEGRPLADLPLYPWQRERHWWDQDWPLPREAAGGSRNGFSGSLAAGGAREDA